ncbi:MAG: amidohydrolase, partial [Caulobacterales bacterium]|nr:amidohydrolase [Caulobacterales bacterium]
AAGRYGPEILELDTGQPAFRIGEYRLVGVRYRGGPFMEPGLRLEAMDRAGVTVQALSPNPLTYFHHIPAADAVRFCQVHNNALAEVVAAAPARFLGLAALPMQEPAAAADELRRCVEEHGFRGAMIGANLPHALDDAALDPVYEAACALDRPLFIHPAPAGIDGPPADPRLSRFELDILFGFSVDETLAALSLILGGALDRHPQLDVCVSHGGGTLPFVAGRLAKACQRRPWAPDFLRPDGAFEERLHRLWFDTHVHDRRSLTLLSEVAHPDHLVFGTNFAGWDQDSAADIGHLSQEALTGNAARLLRLPLDG